MQPRAIHDTARPISRPTGTPWYFITTLIIFWLPLIPLSLLTWKKINREEKQAFWSASFLVGFMTFCMEFIYRRTAKVWTFSEKNDPLLGVRIFGEPVEEFSFWNGATPFILLVYLLFKTFGRKPSIGDVGRHA